MLCLQCFDTVGWHSYLSGARCRLAYGPADSTATHCLFSSKIQIGFTFMVPAHPGSPGQRAVKRVCVCVCLSVCVFSRCELLSYTADCSTLLSRVDSLLSECQQRQSASQQQHYTELTVRSAPSPLITARIQSISQSCIFRVVQVTKSLQDPLEVGNNLPGIGDNVRE